MLRKITDFITKYCYIVFLVVLALAGGCALLSTRVKINHDIYSYMPEDSETSQGLKIMDDEFHYSDTSSYKMMFEDLKPEQKAEVQAYIEQVEHVKSVTYDDSEKHNRTITSEDGTTHDYTLYDVNLDIPADSAEADNTYHEIYDHFREDYTFYESGQVFMYNGSVIQPLITAMAIGCAMLILIIMSESHIEPWLYLFAIMVAVLLNKGTNIIFPNVSHITDSISMILQMALSMDYAIMLSSRYRQEKNAADHPDKRTAMNRALRYSFGAISSSSVTTVVGLIVLVFMSFTIGRDMGLVLSKGVVLSLFSIFTTLPALLLLSDKLIEKTKKKTLHLKMDWLGNKEYQLRKFALPVFLIIFGGAFLLKGNTNILYTGSENNRIKDVFPELNQTAVVYSNSEEERVAELCQNYEDKTEVDRVLCYSNTIGEPEKYHEIIAKANELGNISVSGAGSAHTDTISAEDYLVKLIYYFYYNPNNSETLSLPEFVRFVQNEVVPSPRFADDVSSDTAANIERLSNFVLPEKANRPRTKAELAKLLEIDKAKLDDLYTLYYAKNPRATKLTLYNFASFVTNEILTNPEYAKLVSGKQREQLAKLLQFSNPKVTGTKKSAVELAHLFGLSKEQVEQLLVYYNYTSTAKSEVAIKPKDLIDFALSNEQILKELNLTSDEVAELRTLASEAEGLADEINQELESRFEARLAKLPEESQAEIRTAVQDLQTELAMRVKNIVASEYTYQDYVNLVDRIEDAVANVKTRAQTIAEGYGITVEVSGLPKIDADKYLAKLAEVYKLYEAEQKATATKLTPAEFIDFLLAHKDDEVLKDALTADKLELLRLAKKVVDNQRTLYSASDLAKTFNLDLETLKLVYALYEYRHASGDPMLSVKTLINFIVDTILPDQTYASRLAEDQRAKIYQVSDLMHAAEAGTQYNYSALYRTLLPLSNEIDQDQLFLIYLYYGSLYHYDESWTLTIEQFINFLNDKVLPDSRFAGRIDAEMREKISDGKETVRDAKELLVGPEHSRALIETYLPAEGKETFGFLQGIKNDLGEGNKTKYFVIGDSAMAYEMSQSFGGEMDFITILTMISIFIVVALTFKSILIPAVLVLVIQSAVYLNMAYLSLTGQSIYFIALIIVQAILMGATIDYAILFTSYYLENRQHFKYDIKRALIESYNKSIHAILTSASMLIIVTAIVGNFATAIASKICQSISGGTLVASIIILLLLPALLATMDKFIVKRK